jgi:hypothetical protein
MPSWSVIKRKVTFPDLLVTKWTIQHDTGQWFVGKSVKDMETSLIPIKIERMDGPLPFVLFPQNKDIMPRGARVILRPQGRTPSPKSKGVETQKTLRIRCSCAARDTALDCEHLDCLFCKKNKPFCLKPLFVYFLLYKLLVSMSVGEEDLVININLSECVSCYDVYKLNTTPQTHWNVLLSMNMANLCSTKLRLFIPHLDFSR